MQTVNNFSQLNFRGDKSALADFLEVPVSDVVRWSNEGWYVEDFKIFSSEQDTPQYVLANNAFYSDKEFPLYYDDNAPDQSKPSLVFDIRTGEVYVEYVYGCPGVFFRTKFCFRLSKELSPEDISLLIDRNLDKFQKILNGSSVEYNGSEFVGRYSSEAESWVESLRESLINVEPSEDFLIHEDFDSFLESDPFGKKYNATCLSDIVRHLNIEIESNSYERCSDDLKNDPESAIISYYNWLLTDCILKPNDEVPDWVFEIEELSYFKKSQITLEV
ncbi:MAG: hypothetical protein ABJV04_02860 [Aliiglaciecola sp.]|uniref:hypothetical protein n=1 Tax=Aliiglaciecola sp. TaxID=1872441 RepID=UPI0032976F7D